MGEWAIEAGERIRRVEVHDEYGGGRQGGIAPSRQSPNVLVFSDPSTGTQHGYNDRWVGDVFHYVGEGQTGDQTMTRGNAAILGHMEAGKALRVFWGAKGVVEYAGEFEVSATDPWYTARAKETASEALRDVITFRLIPRGRVEPAAEGQPRARKRVRPVAPMSTPYREANEAAASAPRDPFEVDPEVVDRGLIGHAMTQNLLALRAARRGFTTLSPGAGDPDFDLAWRTPTGTIVVEVKSMTATNESGQLRLGLGQVLDYAHALGGATSGVRPVLAVERRPVEDRWTEICSAVGVTLVWPDSFDGLFEAG